MAPEEHGIGDWVVLRDPGNPVGEVLMKRIPFENMRKRQRELFHQKFGPGTDLTEEERMGY